MAQTLEQLQELLVQNLQELARQEAEYNAKVDEYRFYKEAWTECDSHSVLWSCKKRIDPPAMSRASLQAKVYSLWTVIAGYNSTISQLRTEINRLQIEIGEQTEITGELTDLAVTISGNQAVIDQQQQEISISMLKTYAVPILVVVLVLFGVFMLRQKNK